MILLDNNWWRESADDGIKLDLGDRVTKPLKDDGGKIALNDRTPNQPHPVWAHHQLSAQCTVDGAG